jgi:thiamine-monophosphate kinase
MSRERGGERHIPMGEGAEFDAIRAMLGVWGERAAGIGDDAALLDLPRGVRLVASTDASVEGVHFRREWLTSEEIGARAAAAALSDLAAMGATPIGLLLALGVPDGWRRAIPEIAHGVGEVADQVSCPIVGGNVTRGHDLSLTITVLGTVARPLGRDGVRAGDILFVTGRLGGPGAALAAWLGDGVPRSEHRTRFAGVRPRVSEAQWLAARGATAAIDISDGLLADATHLARASRVQLEVELAALPCMDAVTAEEAFRSGEEYELLVAFPSDALPDAAEFERTFALQLTAVGVAGEGQGVEVIGASVETPHGHDHLA